MGCGTGVLAGLALRLGARRVLGIDCDPKVLRRARAAFPGVEWRRGDLLCGVRERFDVLIANLPQKPVPRGFRLPLGQDGGPRGDAVLGRFLTQAPRHLEPGGRLYLFLHTLAPPGILRRLRKGFRVEVAYRRRRHVAPGEYPEALVAHWRRLGRLEPRPGRRGWHTFEAMQLVAIRRGRPGGPSRPRRRGGP